MGCLAIGGRHGRFPRLRDPRQRLVETRGFGLPQLVADAEYPQIRQGDQRDDRHKRQQAAELESPALEPVEHADWPDPVAAVFEEAGALVLLACRQYALQRRAKTEDGDSDGVEECLEESTAGTR